MKITTKTDVKCFAVLILLFLDSLYYKLHFHVGERTEWYLPRGTGMLCMILLFITLSLQNRG